MGESHLVRSVRELLTIYENQDIVHWWERLNSGNILSERGSAKYMVKLCRTGTPDFIVVSSWAHPKGVTLHVVVDFLECKTEKGRLTQEQKEFQARCTFNYQWANYYVIRDLEEVIRLYASNRHSDTIRKQ